MQSAKLIYLLHAAAIRRTPAPGVEDESPPPPAPPEPRGVGALPEPPMADAPPAPDAAFAFAASATAQMERLLADLGRVTASATPRCMTWSSPTWRP